MCVEASQGKTDFSTWNIQSLFAFRFILMGMRRHNTLTGGSWPASNQCRRLGCDYQCLAPHGGAQCSLSQGG